MKRPLNDGRPGGYAALKRILDFLIALFALALALLPMLLIALLIRADSRGEPIFRQQRIGRGGKPFTCYKFRTMRESTPASCATDELKDAEGYITRFGKFLRKTSLDELPQLVNVLKGDMSLIGPRPLIPEETQVHELRAAAGVYRLRPGLTGYAQIRGRDFVTPEEKAALDEEYLHRISFKTDLQIFFGSIFYVLLAKDIHEGRRD